MHLKENTLFHLDLGRPRHHVIYAPVQFEVAMSNILGGETFTRNVTKKSTHARTDG